MNLEALRKLLKEKREAFDELKGEGDIEEVRALHAEIKELADRINMTEEERQLELLEPRNLEGLAGQEPKDLQSEVRDLTIDELDKEYEGTFLRAFRGQKLTKRDYEIFNRLTELRDAPNVEPHMLTESDEDGGFIVPKTVSTMINEYKRQQEFDLTTLIDVQFTAVIEGTFTYEKLGTITPWDNISQWENIDEVATPQFERKSYKIEDYAGILPLPRTLLQDTDQNLLAHIAKYIAKKSLVTRNLKILEVIEETYTDKKAIETVDDIKDVMDLELDYAFVPNAKIVTNQTGYNFLRKLKDEQGNYLMQPDVTQADRNTIDGHEVIVLPNRTLQDNDGKAPIYFGMFQEAVRFYDRGVYEITPTTIGGQAFIRNSYDIRVIDRFDCIPLDPEAVVAGEIDVSNIPS